MGLFDNLKNTIDSCKETVHNFDKIKDELDKNNISITDIASKIAMKENNDLNISSLQVDWTTNLTDEKKEFDFLGVDFSYRLTKPTNFYITDNDFMAGELCNVYLYSENGVPFDYSNTDLVTSTMITFGLREYACNPEDENKINEYVEYRKAGRAIVEKRNEGNLIYRIHGESNLTYYDCHIYKIGNIDFKIDLVINKKDLNEDKIQAVLNEYYAIINTIEMKENGEYE